MKRKSIIRIIAALFAAAILTLPLSNSVSVSAAGIRILTEEGDITTTFPVEVLAKVAVSIAVTTEPTKKEYYAGDTLDVTGGMFTITYNDSTTSSLPLSYVYNVPSNGYIQYDTSAPDGVSYEYRQVVVAYKASADLTLFATYSVRVWAVTPSSISITTQPTKLTYFENESLDVTGGKIKVTYNSGAVETLLMSHSLFSYAHDWNIGQNTVTVTAGTASDAPTATFTIDVIAIVPTGIAIKKLPNKLKYYQGDNLDVTGGEITITYNNGTTDILPMTASAFTYEYDFSLPGPATVTVYYSTQSQQRLLSMSFTLTEDEEPPDENPPDEPEDKPDFFDKIKDFFKSKSKKTGGAVGGVILIVVIILIIIGVKKR